MQGSDLKAFRKANNLTQDKLGEYLGIKKSFISQVESGKCPLPQEKFIKLLNNPYGWDTSMLTTPKKYLEGLDSIRKRRDFTPQQLHSTIEKVLNPEQEFLVGYLERKVNDLESKIDEKDALIYQLYQQIGMLEAKLDLARKGEIASIAVGSSDANVG